VLTPLGAKRLDRGPKLFGLLDLLGPRQVLPLVLLLGLSAKQSFGLGHRETSHSIGSRHREGRACGPSR
jgi:hypothetical protein